MDKTLYVVSGFMRTGTSMMMKALEAGGIEAVYRQSRDEMKDRFADEFYDPNIGGLYELERGDYLHKDFPKGYEGKLIKILNLEYVGQGGGTRSLSVMPDGIRVVFMKRNTEEIRQSYNAFFSRQLPEGVIETMEERFSTCLERIKNRRDVLSCHDFWYRDVVSDPEHYFQILKDSGWNIDVGKCVSVVDDRYCRFKVEELTKGVL